jgi:uncharacterized protein with FMN-binding domain
MKRAPIVLTGTALGLGGVLGYHTATTHKTIATGSSPSVTTQTATSTTTTSTASASTSRTASSGTRSATGTDVNFQYGDIQLKVTMSGGKITDVSVVTLNVTDPRSQEIDQQAIPLLTKEVISAQSANIDAVSGASYTSQAYEQSLQSALDKLGVTSSASS